MTKLTAQAAGTFAIAPTPFHDDGRIDEASIDRLTDFYTEVGCDGVTVLGILGEAPKLDAAEAEQVALRFVKRAKKLQVIVGVSAPGFATMRSLARKSMDAGAAGVMIAPPPHLRTDDQIIGYFKQAQEAVGDDIPWVLQDYPLTLTVQFTPAVIRKIVMDSPSCVMLKHEDWPGLEKISTLRNFQKDGSLRPLHDFVPPTEPEVHMGGHGIIYTVEDYLKFIANRRLTQIGLKEEYPGTSNPFPWMSEIMDLKKEKNFFETRVIEYQTGGALSWD